MNSISRQQAVGRSYAGEGDVFEVSRLWKYDRSKPLAVYCHGAGGTGNSITDPVGRLGEFQFAEAIASAGYPLVSADVGGTSTWGNQTLRDRLYAYITQAKFPYRGDGVAPYPGRVVLTGVSMGGCACYSFAQAYPQLVACIVVVIPVSDLEDIRTNDRNGYRSWIDAAYGVTYPTPLPAGYNPAQYHDQIVAWNIPVQIWYADNDFICNVTTVTTLGAALSADMHDVGALDHTNAAVMAVDKQQAVNFIDAHSSPPTKRWSVYAGQTWGSHSGSTWKDLQ